MNRWRQRPTINDESMAATTDDQRRNPWRRRSTVNDESMAAS
jgi:hypothetical protein